MEMEDHHHQHHQYANIADLRQLISGGGARPPPHFPSMPHDLFAAAAGHRSTLGTPPGGHQFEMMMVGGAARQVTDIMPRGQMHDFAADSTASTVAGASSSAGATTPTIAGAPPPPTTTNLCGGGILDGDQSGGGGGGGDGGTGRWPRQETLTLLEIRSRLDLKFKEANQKGPLWDEVSRIMSEEHGYQRSGKKCREKFENLYKYYKKTREGKAGRQDGKHYRFFRQLEALYGETSNNPVSIAETHLVSNSNSLRFHGSTQPSQQDASCFQSHHKLCDSLSLSNSSQFGTSSSDDNDLSTAGLTENDSTEKRRKRRGGRSWKSKIKDFIDSQMRKLMEKQEAWLEKMLRTLEQKEQERMMREEEWRKQESARIEREHKFWAKERAWIETRDTALMEILEKIRGRDDHLKGSGSSPEELMGAEFQNQSENQNENGSETLNNNNITCTKASDHHHGWAESEITRLIQLRTSLESRMQQSGHNHNAEELVWEEIASKMSYYGYERSALMCKEKWDAINYYLIRKTKEECNKKRKENSRTSSYFHNNHSPLYSQGQGGAYCEIINEQGPETARLQPNDGSSPSSSNAGNAVQDSCFRFLMGDGDQHVWENYGLKLNNGENL